MTKNSGPESGSGGVSHLSVEGVGSEFVLKNFESVSSMELKAWTLEM